MCDEQVMGVLGEPGHSVECMLSGLESLPNWLLVWADRTGWVMVPGQSRTAEQAHRYYYITQRPLTSTYRPAYYSLLSTPMGNHLNYHLSVLEISVFYLLVREIYLSWWILSSSHWFSGVGTD